MPAATTEGTSRFMTRMIDRGLSASVYPTLGKTGLKVSALGFGCYRVSQSVEAHGYSLVRALEEGCNLIDTSTNYADGDSERLVGEIVSEQIAAQKIARDEIVIVSKVGYVQGHNLNDAQKREQQKRPYPDMVKYMDGCWHCIHPDFIEDQLTQSLSRLGMAKLDVYLLHNPEYFLMDEINKHPDGKLDEIRDVFYDRITRAFRKLEDEVKAGRISYYGVSSNNFGFGVHEREATSVEQIWDIACHVAKDLNGNPYDNHCAVIQLPANLIETNPMLEENCEDGKTVLEFAKEKQLGVLSNRPLNAILGNQMIRLADLKVSKSQKSASAQSKVVVALEEEFNSDIAPLIETGGTGPDPEKLFGWGKELASANLKSFGLEQWKHIELQVIRPQISHLAQAMDKQLTGEVGEKWENWRDRYFPEIVKLLEIIRSDFSKRSKKQIEAISEKVDGILPQSVLVETLSRKALAILMNTPGITTVLNGMRTPEYVDDSMGTMKLERFEIKKDDFKKLSLS